MKPTVILGLLALGAVAGCGKSPAPQSTETWSSATPPPMAPSYRQVKMSDQPQSVSTVPESADRKEEDGLVWIRTFDKKWWVPVQYTDGERRKMPAKRPVK